MIPVKIEIESDDPKYKVAKWPQFLATKPDPGDLVESKPRADKEVVLMRVRSVIHGEGSVKHPYLRIFLREI